MRPPCFGNYSTDRTTPCADCRLRGPCARKVRLPGGMLLSASAHINARSDADFAALPGVVADPGEMVRRLTQENFTVQQGAVRNHAKRLICRLGFIGPTVIVYTPLHRDAVAAHPLSNGCMVRPWREKAKSVDDLKTKGLRTKGAKVYCLNLDDAIRVIRAVALLEAVD